MSSFANQKKLVHDSKTEESDGQSKDIPIHFYSLDGQEQSRVWEVATS